MWIGKERNAVGRERLSSADMWHVGQWLPLGLGCIGRMARSTCSGSGWLCEIFINFIHGLDTAWWMALGGDGAEIWGLGLGF